MDWYKPICAHIITPLWARWEKSDYLKHLHYLTKLQYASADEIQDMQWTKIKSLLKHAYNNSAYYTAIFDNLHLHPADLRTWTDFEKMPLLTKKDIRYNYDNLIAKNIPKHTFITGMTSGSTGKPLHFLSDEKGLQWTRAHIVLTQEWAGWKLGKRKFTVMGIHANKPTGNIRHSFRNMLLDRSFLLNTLELDEDSMFLFYKALKITCRPFIQGFAHAIYLFAQYLEQNNLFDIHACGIITGGMVLNNHERALIEKVFNSKVFNRYGTEEAGVMACECETHEGLHISVGKYYLEFLNDNKEALPGETGSIVVTDLTNYGMPLIRYKIEDMAVLGDKPCSCGRTWPLIKEIVGRTSDFIITPDKKIISGISLTDFFAAIPGLLQIQIIQNKIDHLTYKIIKSSEFTDNSIQKIKEIERRFFGDKMQVSYDYVESIPLEPRGKYRFVKSEIAKEYFGGLNSDLKP